jgi:type IV secretion system protein VirB10
MPPDNPFNDESLTADVGAPSKAPLLRTPASALGARLSKRFKGAALVLIGLLGAGMMLGIMTSGNNPSGASGDTDSGKHMVGKTEPDTSSMQRIAFENKLKEYNDSSSAPKTTASPTGNASPTTSSVAGATGGQGNGSVKTPSENFQNWQEEQRYKSEEVRFTAALSAKNAATYINTASQGTRQPSVDGATSASRPSAITSSDSSDPTRLNNLAAEVARAGLANGNGGAGPNGVYPQTQNLSFMNDQKKSENGYLTSSLTAPQGKQELFAGSLIPSVTTAGINSDLPGTVTAMVRQTVYDSRNEHIVLIPQGTKIVGQYSSSVSYGQQRVLVAWNRLIYPNGSSIDLQGMVGSDGLGQAGLYDSVDNHYFRVFGSAMLVSMLGVAAQLSQPQNTSVLNAASVGSQAAGSASAQLNTVGTNMVNKNLNIAPTLVIAPGFAFNVMVNKTMILPAYR